jgi:hypothetical protein
MPQEDYFKRQVDLLAIALAKLLERFVRLKSTGLLNNDIQLFNNDLKTEVSLDLNDFVNLPAEKVAQIIRERKLNDLHLDMLGEMLFQLADYYEQSSEREKVKSVYAKLILIYEQLASRDPIYSLERHFRIEKMKNYVV